MYRCVPCTAVVGPGTGLIVHRILRSNGQLEGEVPVCPSCSRRLADGTSLQTIIDERTIPRDPLAVDPNLDYLVTEAMQGTITEGNTATRVLDRMRKKAIGDLGTTATKSKRPQQQVQYCPKCRALEIEWYGDVVGKPGGKHSNACRMANCKHPPHTSPEQQEAPSRRLGIETQRS